ncbi:MAG: IMP cyclohydrolase, partial [Oscillospiraceae bacterium]|nr:IMP cyclohydrolase [Oscillospiraceae bacterium]
MTPYTMQNINTYLQKRDYPGRGIVAGLTPDSKHAVAAYFIMGRSENSRNRVFEAHYDGIRTRAFDEAKLTDPSLVIYNAVQSLGRALIVTNGDHTDTIVEHIRMGEGGFETALKTREFEPDPPNFTPRISAITKFYKSDPLKYKLSILKATDSSGTACSRHFYNYT